MSALPALAAAVGAALLFSVQPIIARCLLPTFGGTAAVWTTCLLFFQSLLLVGYAYAHALARAAGGRALAVHGVLLLASLALLPITPDAEPIDPTAATEQLLLALTVAVGLPYTLLSATAPLLQARAAAAEQARPYRLYAWSNAGSIGGLLAHPLLIEPALGAQAQTFGWSVAYGGFAALMIAALVTTRAAHAAAAAGPRPDRGTRALWVGLTATGVALLMSVTDAISLDLTVTPLFWVVPLLLYLLTFVIAFGRPEWAAARWWLPGGLIAAAGLMALVNVGWRAPWMIQLGGYWVALFAGCMALHGALVRLRPEPGRLTAFYLHTAAGGALGGVLVALVGPALSPAPVELPLAVLCGYGLVIAAERRRRAAARDEVAEEAAGDAPAERWRSADGPRLLLIAGALSLLAAGATPTWRRVQGDTDLYRGFYGALQVKRYRADEPRRGIVHLLDGRISHGYQRLDPTRRREATAYFAPQTGIGRVLSRAQPTPRRVGIVGLGAGTLAAYARPGDAFVFFEINPDVASIAEAHFSFLADAPSPVEVVLGDGRQSLAARPPQGYDVLVLDAFSGDAIPAHLLTREAMELWLSHLRDDGVLAINVSNHHADLARVVRAHAATFALSFTRVRARARSPLGPYFSDWMLLARDPSALAELPPPPAAADDMIEWTDDFSPLLPILH